MIRSYGGKTPQIHPTAFVSEAAYVLGDVIIGEGSSVWPGVVIRADAARITIGSHTNIQDNSALHADTPMNIGDYVTVGHLVMCHAVEIGDHSLLGNGATLNHGVKVGAGSLVAAGAVVVEGMDIPPKSLVAGMPARIRGEVEERHTNLIERATQSYIDRTPKFKAEGNLE
ncbi:MAG: gamma carbonic anhydrase family protein [Chloroflexi bacterium]|nr:gamma carbonic anhydrase family protein [Chloroflexota bacterium]